VGRWRRTRTPGQLTALQGSPAPKKQPPPLGPPQDPRKSPTVGSQDGNVSDGRGTPVLAVPHAPGREGDSRF
jgi:hypothetical protein